MNKVDEDDNVMDLDQGEDEDTEDDVDEETDKKEGEEEDEGDEDEEEEEGGEEDEDEAVEGRGGSRPRSWGGGDPTVAPQNVNAGSWGGDTRRKYSIKPDQITVCFHKCLDTCCLAHYRKSS